MPAEKWTLLIVSDEESPIRQFNVSLRVFRLGIGVAVVAALLLGSLLVGLGFGGASRIEANRLAEKNRLLESELAGMRIQVGGLEGHLNQFSELDQQMRVLAGLDPIDAEVLQVGIGGPGTRTPEDLPLWPVDSTLSKETFAISYDLNALERRARLLTESLSEASDSLMAHTELLLSTPSILPAAGVLSSRFSASRFHPIHHKNLPHEGVDISAPHGTPILAAAKGVVTFSGWLAGLGNTVEVDHGFGYVTRYGHASKLLVRRGQEVARGDVIAQVGSTGISTSTHLHYEVHVRGKAVDPMDYVIGNVLP